MTIQAVADWNLLTLCNFRCPYCYFSLKKRKTPPPKITDELIEAALSSFNKTNKIWLIILTGGEPFLHPAFISICKNLTQFHYISINTNLTTSNIKEFCKKIDPEKVNFIHCSLHIAERKKDRKLKDLISKIKLLRQSGFKIYVTQVMTPSALKEFDNAYNYFKEHGITVQTKNLKNLYEGNLYPQSYTDEEKKKILSFIRKARDSGDLIPTLIDVNYDDKWIDGFISFKGSPCAAGKDYVVIDLNGEVYRCHTEKKHLGNIYKGGFNLLPEKQPCIAQVCSCPYFGFKFATGNPTLIKMNHDEWIAFKENKKIVTLR